MTDDLKRQASELYKERTDEIPTSDSLSMKKLFYIVLGLSLLAALVIQTFGGHHGAPTSTSVAPPPVTKELPPPASPQPMAPAPQPEPRKPVDQKAEISRQETEPLKAPNPSFGKKENRKSASPEKQRREPAKPVKQADSKPETTPGVTPVEAARQELARDIVLEKSPALTTMIGVKNDNPGLPRMASASSGDGRLSGDVHLLRQAPRRAGPVRLACGSQRPEHLAAELLCS